MVSADRWLEMDLTWFDPAQPFDPQIETLLGRVSPLLTSVSGWRGLCFNIGWLIDVVTEWTGDPAQKLPLQSRRTAAWSQRSYADLRAFFAALRDHAVRHGLDDLKIGVLFVGWAHVVWPPELKIYDFDSAWYGRHHELYDPPKSFINMPDLHPIKRLHADDYPYAAFPQGLSEGAYFPEFFGAQWASLAEFLDLDMLHLRDGLMGPMIYTRNGPFGTHAPKDPQTVAAFSQSVRDLYRCIKQAAPDRLLFGYSSAISPIADWRVGCVDFEALVADGFIDGWIEQTWGGAWQDWWHQLWKGWTFQLANLLTRGAMIARANQQRENPCRFYCLIETWDGWEPWDTLHQVPDKLRWAMWAFTHAAAITAHGIHVPHGAYISWMNNGAMQLLSDDDIEYVNTHLTAAQADALTVERVYGWSLNYDRTAMQNLSETQPDANASEWLDDQAALLMKWGVPILSVTRTEWLDELENTPDALIAALPRPADEAQRAAFTAVPVLVTGRADLIDPNLRESLGFRLAEGLVSDDFHIIYGRDVPSFERPYLPEHAIIVQRPNAGVDILIRTERTPLLTRRGSLAYWQPPDWSEPFNPFVPKYQLGSTYPHFRTAALLHEMAFARGLSVLEDIERPAPIAFHLWRSADGLHMLLGNLETGEFGDSRTPRLARVCLSRPQLGLDSGGYALQRVDDEHDSELIMPIAADATWLRFRVTLPPESAALYRVVAN